MRVLLIATLVCLGAAIGCNETKSRVPTGLEVRDGEDGKLLFVATARASQNAIEKNLFAMKQSTCLEGARLLIQSGLQDRGLERSKFRRENVQMISAAEYCRLSGTYYPEGVPKEKSRSKSKAKAKAGS